MAPVTPELSIEAVTALINPTHNKNNTLKTANHDFKELCILEPGIFITKDFKPVHSEH